MKVLLIDPPWIIENDNNLWKKVGSCLPSLGLGYVAAVLEKDGHKVRFLDCTAEKISVKAIESILKSYDAPDFVGLTATTPLVNNARAIAAICKRLYPGVKVVLGGIHPSFMPDEVLGDENVDFVVRHEGEITMKELVAGKNPREIPGLSYKSRGKIIHNPERPLIKNLDELPPPAYHLMPMKKYRPAIGNYKRLPAMSIFATRGCPGKCTFCQPTFGGMMRPRSAKNILEEIKLLQDNYGIKEISFYDDTFTVFRNVVKEFCETIIREKIDLTWSCFTRANFVNEELLALMKKAGCHLILFGVESADEQILKNIRKEISLDLVVKAVKTARKVGIETRTSFMIGNPGETEETIKKSIDFAIRLDPDEVQFNITTVFPGTEMFKWADEKGYIITKDWSKYNMSDIVWRHPNLSPETMERYYRLAHRKFYLRPRVILRRLSRIRSWDQVKQELKGFLAVVGM